MPNKRGREYEFELILDGPEDVDDEMVGKLLAVGCDDGFIGRSSGVIFASFGREAESFEDAVFSAIRDITKAEIGVTGFRLDARDLVTLSDVARRIGKTKQSISHYATGRRGPGGFPAPAIESKDPLYQWSDVAGWLQRHGLLPADAVREAEARRAVHAALEYGHVARRNPEVVRKFAEWTDAAAKPKKPRRAVAARTTKA